MQQGGPCDGVDLTVVAALQFGGADRQGADAEQMRAKTWLRRQKRFYTLYAPPYVIRHSTINVLSYKDGQSAWTFSVRNFLDYG